MTVLHNIFGGKIVVLYGLHIYLFWHHVTLSVRNGKKQHMWNNPHIEDKLKIIVRLGGSAVYKKEIFQTVLITYSPDIKHVLRVKGRFQHVLWQEVNYVMQIVNVDYMSGFVDRTGSTFSWTFCRMIVYQVHL